MPDFEIPQFLQHPERTTDSLCTRCLNVVRVSDTFPTLTAAQAVHVCVEDEITTPAPRANVLQIDQHRKHFALRVAALRTATS